MNDTLLLPEKCIEQPLNMLHNFLTKNDPLLCVLGAAGTGKSALLQTFNQSADMPTHTLVMKGRESLTPEKLIQTVCHAWDLDTPNQTLRQEAMCAHLLTQCELLQEPALLIIDASDQLPLATLAGVLHLVMAQQHHAIHCRIILFGRLPLQTMLQTLLDPTLSLETIELKPWTLEQTRHFLMHSLAHMDIHEEATLDDALVENIHMQSNGIPKNVAILAEAAFQQYQQPPQFRNQDTHTDEAINHTYEHHQQPMAPDNHISAPSDHAPTAPRWTKHWVKTTCVIALVGVLFGLHRYENSMMDQTATVIAAPPKPAPTVATLPPVVAPVVPSKPRPAPAAQIKPTAPVVAAAPAMPYRLQLMASTNRQKLHHLAQSATLTKQKPYVIAKQSHGKILYTLNIGHYANAQSARQALKQLPSAIQAKKPWLTHG